MIQYKHASVAAFEGYAGTSASGFRAEIEAQRRLGQTDDLLDYFDRRQGGASLGGPAGPRIGRTLDDAAVQLGPRSEEHTSELQSLMRNSYAVFCLKKKINIVIYMNIFILLML